jgi:diguanylate cyclase (GGDEF)-like protein
VGRTAQLVCLVGMATVVARYTWVLAGAEFEHRERAHRVAAAALRRGARSFELIYRVGGEEFLIVLPCVDVGEARVIAERLRVVLQDAQPGGLPVTASFGVSGGTGKNLDFVHLMQVADGPLRGQTRRP